MPVVVFYGDESYLLEQAAQQLRQSVVNPAMAGLCHRIYKQPTLSTVLEAVGSVSLALGGQTLVELREFSGLMQASKDSATDAQLEELKSLLQSADPTKTILFLNNKVDGKIKFAKWLVNQPGFDVRKFERFKFWETDKAMQFLIRDARDKGLTLNPDAAELLVNTLGTDLRLLITEVDKLALYAHQRPITLADALILSQPGDNLFALIHRWIRGEQPTDNYRDLQEILLRRHPVEIFATIQSTFANLFRVVWLQAHGTSMEVIAQRTGQKPFSIRKNLDTFRKVPLTRWVALKRHLVELEWKTKTGQLDGQLALETLLGV